jgi:hypothetical protein
MLRLDLRFGYRRKPDDLLTVNNFGWNMINWVLTGQWDCETNSEGVAYAKISCRLLTQ